MHRHDGDDKDEIESEMGLEKDEKCNDGFDDGVGSDIASEVVEKEADKIGKVNGGFESDVSPPPSYTSFTVTEMESGKKKKPKPKGHLGWGKHFVDYLFILKY